jgi:hypothetical protein
MYKICPPELANQIHTWTSDIQLIKWHVLIAFLLSYHICRWHCKLTGFACSPHYQLLPLVLYFPFLELCIHFTNVLLAVVLFYWVEVFTPYWTGCFLQHQWSCRELLDRGSRQRSVRLPCESVFRCKVAR